MNSLFNTVSSYRWGLSKVPTATRACQGFGPRLRQPPTWGDGDAPSAEAWQHCRAGPYPTLATLHGVSQQIDVMTCLITGAYKYHQCRTVVMDGVPRCSLLKNVDTLPHVIRTAQGGQSHLLLTVPGGPSPPWDPHSFGDSLAQLYREPSAKHISCAMNPIGR